MKKHVNKISVFNLIKGIGILFVILHHGKMPFLNRYAAVPDFINHVFDTFAKYSLMSVFLILSGYLMRKQSVEKYLKHQVNLIIKPYFVTACVTVFLVFLRNLFKYHITFPLVIETAKTALAFLLGIAPSGLRFFQLQYMNCGPVWFLLALIISTTMFLWVLNHVDEKKHLWILAGFCVLYFPLLLLESWIPFSLSRGIQAYIPVYLGYWMKKQKLLDKPLSKYHWLLGALCFLGSFGVEMGYVGNVLLQMFFIGFGGLYIAFLTIYLFCYCGDNGSWLIDKLEFIGQNSLIFLCVHTVEYKSLPWGKLSNCFMDRPVVGVFVIFILEVAISVVGSILVLNRKTLWTKIRVA